MKMRVRKLVLGLLTLVAVITAGLITTAGWALAAGDANESACPNEASSGFRSYLPDCRAYELVSPPFKDAVRPALAAAPEAPETLSPAESITATTAVLEGVLNPNAEANTGWYFDYSTEAKCTENAS